MKKIELNLFDGRHDLPANKSIFKGALKDVTDVKAIEDDARTSLQLIAYSLGYGTDEVVFDFPRNAEVTIYVTGLTVALIATLNVLRSYNAKVTLAHYNRESGSYYFQEVRWALKFIYERGNLIYFEDSEGNFLWQSCKRTNSRRNWKVIRL